MYQLPVLFDAISNRESWVQTVEVFDDETGDPIALQDASGNNYVQAYLEISPERHHGCWGNQINQPVYYDFDGEPIITADLTNYLFIVEASILQIQIPYTVIESLHGGHTYNVYLRFVFLPDFSSDFSTQFNVSNDARQILIGKLPVYYGGRRT